MKQHNNTAYVNVRKMSDWEFTKWTGGWTREQAQACMLRNQFSPMPARAMAPGARMSVSEPGKVWVENFQKPLGVGCRDSYLDELICGEIGQ